MTTPQTNRLAIRAVVIWLAAIHCLTTSATGINQLSGGTAFALELPVQPESTTQAVQK
jgi:hypothetical protein